MRSSLAGWTATIAVGVGVLARARFARYLHWERRPTRRASQAGMRIAFTRQRMIGLFTREDAADLAEQVRTIEAGAIRPRLDTVYQIDRVADGVEHIGAGRARSKVVLTV